MKNKKSNKLKQFEKYHHVQLPNNLNDDFRSIEWLVSMMECVDYSLANHCNNSIKTDDSTWAITRTMLHRVYEQTEGTLLTFFTGAWASTEALARVVIESSINVMFVLDQDTSERLSQYFSFYFMEAYKARERYDIASAPDSSKDVLDNLKWRESFVKAFFQSARLPPLPRAGWPPQIKERFRLLNREVEYREIYASLSSQIHGDADSLIDYLIYRTFSEEKPHLHDAQMREMLYWMRHYVYRSLSFYADASLKYAIRYELGEARKEIDTILQSILRHNRALDKEFTASRRQSIQ